MIVVRPFQESDVLELWRVHRDAIHRTASRDYSPGQVAAWAPMEIDPLQWRDKMRKLRPFVAELDGAVAAYADLQDDGYIDHFFVAPEASGRGVGSALMRHILSLAPPLGIRELYANVSITARPFFEHFGFQVESPQTVTLRGVEFTNYRMRRVL